MYRLYLADLDPYELSLRCRYNGEINEYIRNTRLRPYCIQLTPNSQYDYMYYI